MAAVTERCSAWRSCLPALVEQWPLCGGAVCAHRGRVQPPSAYTREGRETRSHVAQSETTVQISTQELKWINASIIKAFTLCFSKPVVLWVTMWDIYKVVMSGLSLYLLTSLKMHRKCGFSVSFSTLFLIFPRRNSHFWFGSYKSCNDCLLLTSQTGAINDIAASCILSLWPELCPYRPVQKATQKTSCLWQPDTSGTGVTLPSMVVTRTVRIWSQSAPNWSGVWKTEGCTEPAAAACCLHCGSTFLTGSQAQRWVRAGSAQEPASPWQLLR